MTSATAPYAKRLVDVQFTAPAASGITFGPSRSNILTLSGLRVSATITKAGQIAMGMASIQIFGMTQTDMNALSSQATFGYYASKNITVTILAGDAASGMNVAFEGIMTSALADFNDMPNASFAVLAYQTFNAAIDQPAAQSFPGTVSIVTICQQIANALNLKLENNGCNAVLTNQYLQGSTLDQLQRATTAAGVLYDIGNGVLAIWPNGGYRTTQTSNPVMSTSNGMVGYPQYTSVGVNFRSLYNPSLIYGTLITMQSSLQPACGKWVIYNLTHTLEANVPNGDWFTDAQCCVVGSLTIVTNAGY